tara:strand:- start:2788 stop:3690 length:903 start_codon:yes stop_codon:yes gene_type:complete
MAIQRASIQSLSRYSPQKGLKTIAILEAVQKHYARAKDASKLEQAIRSKLEAQAEFVLWWDTKGPGEAGKGRPQKNVTDPLHFRSGHDGLPDRMTISRWRRKLNDPENFELTFRAALDRYVCILELQKQAHVGQSTGENEWYTPIEYIEAARQTMGAIDLDPASTALANNSIRATKFFTRAQDGLTREWQGRIWMNPPYAQPAIVSFAEKFAISVEAGSTAQAIALVNNATETEWFSRLVSVCRAICFPKGRLRFWGPGKDSGAPLQGQAVLYAGPDAKRFCASFSHFGFLARVHDPKAR